jgi:glyoxylase-like metal-dependent hydrolase (beta-lactamase superfamily II)
MADPKLNASAHFEALFALADEATRRKVSKLNIRPFTCRADEVFSKHKCFSWQGHKIEIRETPGHSRGSVCTIIDDTYVFTGDSLIKGRPTITRLPGGSRKEFVDATLPFLRNLPQSSVVFPGHGGPGYMREFSLAAG